MKLYKMSHGNASKYMWFSINETVYEGFDFIKHIKENQFTIKSDTGKHEADCHGTTTGLSLYSEKIITYFNETFKN